MSELTIAEYQKTVDKWVKTFGVRYFSELTNLGILMEEVGETARLMTRTYGEQSFKTDEKDITTVIANTSKFKLYGMPPTDFPDIPDFSDAA